MKETVSVALLRGINVGGRGKLPMASLRDLMESVGCRSVRTYIQSGNAVFAHDAGFDDIAHKLAEVFDDRHGFRPEVLVLTASSYRNILDQNPFTNKNTDPKNVHIWFTSAVAQDVDIEKIEALGASSEQFELRDRAFYLHAPDGIGRSKLAAGVERCLGVPATARNGRTANAILTLLNEHTA